MNLRVKVSPAHPTGERFRGGVAFTRQWADVDVDADAAAEIMADPYLVVEGAPETVIDGHPAGTISAEAPPVLPSVALEDRTISELRAYAAEKEIDLGKARKKDDILALL